MIPIPKFYFSRLQPFSCYKKTFFCSYDYADINLYNINLLYGIMSAFGVISIAHAATLIHGVRKVMTKLNKDDDILK